MSSAFKDISERFKININAIFEQIFKSQNVQEWIISANQGQLYDDGVYYTGKKIKTYSATGSNVYAKKTIGIKREKGQPTDRVTLFDKGDFYDSWKMFAKKTHTEIQANAKSIKLIENNVPDTPDIFGLTDKNFERLTWDVIYPEFIKQIRDELL